ncbi:amidohydrolase [Amycolatopsis suaedae]|uniref:Peptidase M20 domain-containing protein 2 n=1 Tax=Amycolatopsis suaedae TaxID=2510978 RepID=A0A4Q7J5Q9_9PSEU|nr:amidohydrolase [Amycolatopsis suaedae]RZQ62457.1 amidohydrolase [Amycolatopsis suaedae]
MNGVHTRIAAAVRDLGDRLWDVATDLHANPELAFAEHYAAGRLTAELSAAGFTIDRPVAGLDTAFTGRFGDGGPATVALLLEYDALPELGHACGHNLIAAAGLGAALALAHALPEPGGTVLAVGTPAEEGGGGKVILTERGVFDGVDAALMFHPAGHTWTSATLTAFTEIRMTMRGKAGHPTGDRGIAVNALDALLRAFLAATAENDRLPPGGNVHGIITAGGTRTNIVPDYAEARLALRSPTTAGLDGLCATVTAHAHRAAAEVGAVAEVVRDGPAYDHFRANDPLAERFGRHLAAAGLPPAPSRPEVVVGSSDIGNVSTVVPAIHPLVAIVDEDVSDHTPEFAAAAAGPRARTALLAATEALARTAADVLLDPGLRDAAHAAFARERDNDSR